MSTTKSINSQKSLRAYSNLEEVFPVAKDINMPQLENMIPQDKEQAIEIRAEVLVQYRKAAMEHIMVIRGQNELDDPEEIGNDELPEFFSLKFTEIPDYFLPILRIILAFVNEDYETDLILNKLQWESDQLSTFLHDSLRKYAEKTNSIFTFLRKLLENPEMISQHKIDTLRSFMEGHKDCFEFFQWKRETFIICDNLLSIITLTWEVIVQLSRLSKYVELPKAKPKVQRTNKKMVGFVSLDSQDKSLNNKPVGNVAQQRTNSKIRVASKVDNKKGASKSYKSFESISEFDTKDTIMTRRLSPNSTGVSDRIDTDRSSSRIKSANPLVKNSSSINRKERKTVTKVGIKVHKAVNVAKPYLPKTMINL